MEIQKPQLNVLLAEHAKLELPISPEEDIRIRKLDLFGKEDGLTEEEESILARNVERFLQLHTVHQTNKGHMNAELVLEYFQAILEQLKAEGIEFNAACEPMNVQNKKALITEAFRISRDAIMAMGISQYDNATLRLERNASHEIDPMSIVEETAQENADFYADEEIKPNFWEEANPIAWARDCLLLAKYPEVLQSLADQPRNANKIPSVYAFILETYGNGHASNEEPESEEQPPLSLTPEQLEMIEVFRETLEGMEQHPLNRYTKMGYKPLTNPSQGAYKSRAYRFLNAVHSRLPQEGEHFQYRLAQCAEAIAKSIKARRKAFPPEEQDRLPNKMDISNVIGAAKRFRHLALLKNAFERESADGKKYTLKPQVTSPDVWVLSIFRDTNLLHRRLEDREFNLSHGFTDEDRAIFNELLAERSLNAEKIVKTFQIHFSQQGKGNGDTSEAIHTLYVLTHFMCRIADELRKRNLSVETIKDQTADSVQQATEI